MNKELLPTAMALITATGLLMLAMALLSMPQDPSQSYSYWQLWEQLWEQRPVFCWVWTVYFSVMSLADLWVGAGMLFGNYYLFRETPGKKNNHKSTLDRPFNARGGLLFYGIRS